MLCTHKCEHTHTATHTIRLRKLCPMSSTLHRSTRSALREHKLFSHRSAWPPRALCTKKPPTTACHSPRHTHTHIACLVSVTRAPQVRRQVRPVRAWTTIRYVLAVCLYANGPPPPLAIVQTLNYRLNSLPIALHGVDHITSILHFAIEWDTIWATHTHTSAMVWQPINVDLCE